MNETINLHLPQFEATDRIHHDDFNDAMEKLDTAVKALADRSNLQVIATVPILQDTSRGVRYGMATLPTINWSEYFCIHVEVTITGFGDGVISPNKTFSYPQSYQLGGSSPISGSIGIVHNTEGASTSFLFLPHYDSTRKISGLLLSEGLGYCSDSGTAYQDWSTVGIHMSESSYTITGGSIKIRGIK